MEPCGLSRDPQPRAGRWRGVRPTEGNLMGRASGPKKSPPNPSRGRSPRSARSNGTDTRRLSSQPRTGSSTWPGPGPPKSSAAASSHPLFRPALGPRSCVTWGTLFLGVCDERRRGCRNGGPGPTGPRLGAAVFGPIAAAIGGRAGRPDTRGAMTGAGTYSRRRCHSRRRRVAGGS